MKDLYKKLAELEPTRFKWHVDDDDDTYWLHDLLLSYSINTLRGSGWWRHRAIAQEGVTRIDRADGQTWEEAMLQALVAAVEKRVKG